MVYQCLNAPYTRWPVLFPPLQAGVLAAAERTGALLAAGILLLGTATAGFHDLASLRSGHTSKPTRLSPQAP